MEKFDHEASTKALHEREAMQEDEEGWIMVTKRFVELKQNRYQKQDTSFIWLYPDYGKF